MAGGELELLAGTDNRVVVAGVVDKKGPIRRTPGRVLLGYQMNSLIG